jgi:hypothetical protein
MTARPIRPNPLAYICRRRAVAARCRARLSRCLAVWRVCEARLPVRVALVAAPRVLFAEVARVDDPRVEVLARRFVWGVRLATLPR